MLGEEEGGKMTTSTSKRAEDYFTFT